MPASGAFRDLLGRLGEEFERLEAENNEFRTANGKLQEEIKSFQMQGVACLPGALSTSEDAPLQPVITCDTEGVNGSCAVSGARRPSAGGADAQDDYCTTIVESPTDKFECDAHDSLEKEIAQRRSETSSPENVRRSKQTAEILKRIGTGAVGQHAIGRTQSATSSRSTTIFDHFKRRPRGFRDFVESDTFDALSGLIILINTLVMAAERQFSGMANDYHFGRSSQAASEWWQSGSSAFKTLNFIFGIIYLVELLVKLIALRKDFPKSFWNWLDGIIVGFWLVEILAAAAMLIPPTLLRMLRIFRLIRLAKMAKTIQAFDSLNVLIGSIGASVSVLFWATQLLLLVQMLVALLLCAMLEPFILDESNPYEDRQQCHLYFGSFSRSMITVFELALANWAPVCHFLVNSVDEFYGPGVVFYKLGVGFAVVNVITGVFMHETFKVASSDDELMIVQKRRQNQKHALKMRKLLQEADTSGDGFIQREEFIDVLNKPGVRTWLSAMDIEVNDGEILFAFLDNGDEKLSVEELIEGIARLKGTARSIDIVGLTHRVSHIEDLVQEFRVRFEELQRLQKQQR